MLGQAEQIRRSIQLPACWEELFTQKKPNNIKLHLWLSKTLLSPSDVFKFILRRTNVDDQSVINTSIEIIESLLPDLNAKELISQFPESDETIQRSLYNALIPIPLTIEYAPFLFRSASSSLPYNRQSFLRYLIKASDKPFPPNVMPIIVKVLEALGADHSPSVLTDWIKPALIYLKGSPSLPTLLSTISKNADIEVRSSIALNIEQIYPIEHSCLQIISSPSLKVYATIIPHLVALGLPKDKFNTILNCNDQKIKIQILRFASKLVDDAFLNQCMDDSLPVRVQLVSSIRNGPEQIGIISKLIQRRMASVKEIEQEWRLDLELLSLPLQSLNKMKQQSFSFALQLVERHPYCLREKAIEVVAAMAKVNSEYLVEATKRSEVLLAAESPFRRHAGELLAAAISK